MKIVSWKKFKPNLYLFSLYVSDGLIVNGFWFRADTKQVLSPLAKNNFRIVKAWGKTWRKIQKLCQERVAQEAREGDDD